MDDVYHKIGLLEAKINELIEKKHRLEDIIKELTNKNETLIKERDELKEKITSMENKSEAMQMVSSEDSAFQNNRKIKLLINDYIKEIDKCITFLEQLENE